MREEGILKQWILPEEGMNDKIVIDDGNGKVITNLTYKGRPVGDCPKAMPLDNSLFRDLRTSLDKHLTLTCIHSNSNVLFQFVDDESDNKLMMNLMINLVMNLIV